MSHDFKEYLEAWQIAQSGWSTYQEEALKDVRAFCGDQWSPEMRQYLKDQGRSDAIYNKVKRVVNFITGYERRNRLSLNGKPRGNADDSLANQHSAILLNVMSNYDGNNICSDAFKFGTCISGLNLIETFIDPTTGNIGFNRDAYNQVLLDPMFTKPDLSDCGFILRERAITRNQAYLFFPGQEAKIDKLPTGTNSNLFSRATHNSRVFTKDSIVYGEYHRQTIRNAIMLIDRQTGIEEEFKGNQQELEFINSDPQMRLRFAIRSKFIKAVRLQVYLQEELFYDGPDPYGMDEYRFVPVMGDYVPELPDDKYKLQGIVRSIRDPNVEFNKRMSQMTDIFESQIASGFIAIDGAMVDPKSLYGTGQGKVLFVKGLADNPAGVEAVKRIQAPVIGPGMDQFADRQASLIDTMAGTNEELFGSDNKDIPGVLSRMRTGAALTIMHPYFDGYRFAKRRLGKLIIQMVQKNYSPAKVEQLIEEQVHPEFYDTDILDNDITVQEGLHTDSQRETAYMEMKSLKAEGMTGIPDSYILELMPIHMKTDLQKHMQQIEQAQQKKQAEQEALERQQLAINSALAESETAKNMASVRKTDSEIAENLAEAMLDHVKALVLKEDHDNEISHPNSNTGHVSHDKPRKPRHNSSHKKKVVA